MPTAGTTRTIAEELQHTVRELLSKAPPHCTTGTSPRQPATKPSPGLRVMDRIRALDTLRGIAALSVLLYHYTAWYDGSGAGHHTDRLWFWLPYGNFGVELFFIISGFVILMTLERVDGFYDFAVGRLSRLYPAFLTCLALTILTLYLSGFEWDRLSAAVVAANLTMVPQSFRSFPIDGSYWSLFPEIAFYTLAASVYLGARWRSVESFSITWMTLAALALLKGAASIPYRLVIVTNIPFCNLFVIGMMIYRIYTGQQRTLTYFVLTSAIAMGLFGPDWSYLPIGALHYTLLVACFALAVWAATCRRLPLLEIAPLVFLGEISYPLYLLHQQAGFAVIRKLEALGANPNVAVAIAMLLTIGTATLVSRLIEKPGRRWLRMQLKCLSTNMLSPLSRL